METNEPSTSGTLQRVLAFIIAGLVILTLVCFTASLIGYFAGVFVTEPEGIWPTIIMLPLIALPAAFALTIVLIVVTSVRRSRANRR